MRVAAPQDSYLDFPESNIDSHPQISMLDLY